VPGDVQTARLLITCPDARGIIAAVAGFIAEHHGNILEADQHSDPTQGPLQGGCWAPGAWTGRTPLNVPSAAASPQGTFFMRVEIELDGFDLTRDTFATAWEAVARRFGMRWNVYWGNEVKRMAILVSKESHCVSDLLWRWRNGELRVDVPWVVGNHVDLLDAVRSYGVTFHHLPVSPETRTQQEARLVELLESSDVDFIVLARYMQVLSSSLVSRFAQRIINIHHSFLPAFAGPRPYHQAFDRGVKIIGATSHYVTDQLDEGPIIAQATLAIDHRDTVEDLVRKGRDLERVVLADAVRLHVEDKILVSHNKTVVFD